MHINTNNTTNVNHSQTNPKTQESAKNLEQTFDISKPFDVDEFTYKDYKTIATTLDSDDLRNWLKNSDLDRETEVKIGSLLGMTSYSDDEILNEVLFDKLNETYDRGEDFGDFMLTVLLPIADMHAEIDKPIDYENSLMNPEVAEAFKNDPKNWSTSLSGGGRRTLDYSFKSEDLFNYMKDYPAFYKRVDEIYPGFYKSPTPTTQAFNEIIAEYTKRKEEQNSTLAAYTKNNKQTPSFE